MNDTLQRLDKRAMKICPLDDLDEENRYWFTRTAEERLHAVEMNRRMVYRENRVASRLQRFLVVVELPRR